MPHPQIMLPRLSIIVPVYNAGSYLADCVASLLAQSFQDVEVILVNDGSTDNSGAICERYARQDVRVRVVHKQNGGQSSARNAALDICRGEYITFVDADDAVSADAFAHSVSVLDEDTAADVVQFPVVQGYGTPSAQLRYTEESAFEGVETLYRIWLIDKRISNYVCAKLFRRNLFAALRFREGLVFEDRYLMANILGAVRRLRCTAVGRYLYYCRPNSTTNREETAYSLRSKILADLNIVEHTQIFPSLRATRLERFYNGIYYAHRLHAMGERLDAEVRRTFTRLRPTWDDILCADIPKGMKYHLLRWRCLGVW